MAAQKYPGVRLLLLAEYRSPVPRPEKCFGLVKDCELDRVQTKDGSVSFRPVLHVKQIAPLDDVKNQSKPLNAAQSSQSSEVWLSLKMCKFANTMTMIYCKMITEYKFGFYGFSKDGQKPENATQFPLKFKPGPLPEQETVVLRGKMSVDELPLLQCKSLFVAKVTVLIKVFDISFAQRPATGVRLCLNEARLDGSLCDVKLVVDGVELPAHRMVLGLRCPVLIKEARDGRIEVVGFSKDTVKKFLEFLYTDQIQDWGDSEMGLLELAEKYQVSELRDECCLRLWSCDGPRALKVLHAAGLGEQVLSRPLRRRLTTTVIVNLEALADTEDWAVFQTTNSVFADIITAAAAHKSESTSSVWPRD